MLVVWLAMALFPLAGLAREPASSGGGAPLEGGLEDGGNSTEIPPGNPTANPPDPVRRSLPEKQRAYLAQLKQRAAGMKLWRHRTWRLLLHYRPDPWGPGYTSEADGPGFFLAEGGKSGPRAELNATLAGFFTDTPGGPLNITPQCAFPARYRWLDSQLDFDPDRLQVQGCEQYERWRTRVDADSVSLIFSSYFFNNPASMFGHTLLLFHKKGRERNTELLDFAVNYSAYVPPEDNAIAFAIFGIFGGYQGRFSMLPYYVKVKEYNDFENRDMWEYRLGFSPERVGFMLAHAWELGSTYFDYFFFKENCSYHLLSLLEIGDPSLHLTDEYGLWTLPGDTVKQLARVPGLVTDVVYRPSLGSQLRQKLSRMEAGEKDWVATLIDRPAGVEARDFQALPPSQRARVLDAVIDYYQYKLTPGAVREKEERQAGLRRLLLSRAAIPAAALPPEDLPWLTAPPDTGHDSAKFSVAAGAARILASNGASNGAGSGNGRDTSFAEFAEFSVQPAFHDLMSRDAGYAPFSQINLLHLRVRYEREPAQWRLERLGLIDMVSLSPLSRLIAQPSWKFGLGWQRNRDIACGQCAPFFLNAGIGVSVETAVFDREVYFAMVEGSYEYSRHFDSGHRAGFGFSAGILVDLVEAWRIGIFGWRTKYTEGHVGTVGKAEFRQRISLSRNIELTLDWGRVENYSEGKLGLGIHF